MILRHGVYVYVCVHMPVYIFSLSLCSTILEEHIYICKGPIMLLTNTWIEMSIREVEDIL